MISGTNRGGLEQKISLYSDDIILLSRNLNTSEALSHRDMQTYSEKKNFTLVLDCAKSDFTRWSSFPLSLTGLGLGLGVRSRR